MGHPRACAVRPCLPHRLGLLRESGWDHRVLYQRNIRSVHARSEIVMKMTVPRAGRRELIGLAVIALPCLVYAMDLTVLNLAIPSLSAALAPSSAQLLWI